MKNSANRSMSSTASSARLWSGFEIPGEFDADVYRPRDLATSFHRSHRMASMITSNSNAEGVSSQMTRAHVSNENYKGKYIAMFICGVLGLGTLLPWNAMLTVGDYYYLLFPNYHAERVLTAVYPLFGITMMGILAYKEARVDTRKRILIGFILFFICACGLLVIDLATTGKSGIRNFVGICVLVAAFGISEALVEGGMVGDLTLMCPEFIQSYIAGMAASGALTSALRLVTKAVFDKTDHGLRKGVILFLVITAFVEFTCILLYAFVFPKLPTVIFFHKKAAADGSKTVGTNLSAAGIETNEIDIVGDLEDRLSNKQLIVMNIKYLLSIFFVFVVTMSVVPGFLYENTGNHKLGSWYAVVLIGMYNMGDLISRFLPLVKRIRMETSRSLLVTSMLRLIFIPCFYFTAKLGDAGWMLMLIFLFGLTTGYLVVCLTTAAPKRYNAPEQNALGNLLVFFMHLGILSGSMLDWLWVIGHGGLLGGGVTPRDKRSYNASLS